MSATGGASRRRRWSRLGGSRGHRPEAGRERARLDGEDAAPLRFSDLVLDERTHEVHRGQRSIELTRTEFRLLKLLLENPRQVLPRELIFDRIWGYDFGPQSNTLRVYIGYLRRKTEAGGEPRLIHTVRGFGYMLHE